MKQLLKEIRHDPLLWLLAFVPVVLVAEQLMPGAHTLLFVAPVLVLMSYFIGPTPMDLQFWPGAVVMILIATLTASLVTNSGRSAWFVGVLVLMVYLIFAMTLYLLPPRAQ
jgi:ABC-type transport system involved in cytochrome c biogenesis permease subunit